MTSRKLIALLPLFSAALLADTLYVSTAGKAEWSGKLPAANAKGNDGPLPNLTIARDRIRDLRRRGHKGPMTVMLREGTYQLDATLVLTPEDSDETYVAFKDEHPIISGGQVISGWKQQQPDSGLWITGLPFPTTQLFISGSRAQRSRLPLNGFYLSDGFTSASSTFRFRGSEIKPGWEKLGVELVSLHNWSVARRPLRKVDLPSAVAEVATPNPPPKVDNARFWLENVPEPQGKGQWYASKENATIAYWPLPEEVLSSEETVIPRLEILILLQGNINSVKNVSFRGLSFRYTAWSLPHEGFVDNQAAVAVPAAFIARAAQGVVIDHCTFSELGGYALWFGRGAIGDTLSNSEIFDAGGGGVKIGELEFPKSASDKVGSNEVTNNEIHDLGAVYPSAVGIWVGWSGNNKIAHNDLHDFYYSAISIGWTWGYAANPCSANSVENNHIHEIGKGLMSDMGGIYTLGPQPGTVIKNNLIHNISAYDYGGWGIYLDEGSSNLQIENNIVYRTSSSSLHQHYGKDNNIRNNIFAFGEEYQIILTRAESHLSFNLERNIVIYSAGRIARGLFGSAQVSADQNLYWDERGPAQFRSDQWADWIKSGHDTHSLITDPLFVDAAAYDFRLQEGSSAIRLGFRPIDISTVGPTSVPGAWSFAGQ